MTSSGNNDATYGGHPFILRFNWAIASQSIAGNYSTINWNLQTIKNASYSPYRTDSAATWSFNYVGSGNWGPYNFNGGIGQTITMASGSFNIGHNSDGTATFSPSFSANAASTITTASGSGSWALDTIPRASTPSFSANPADAGTSVTITTNRADASFTHTLTYAIGSSSGTIATGVGASTAWTIPLSLMNEIPNSTTGAITIGTTTFSGATTIGTSSVTLTMSVPTTVIPTLTTVTNSEATTSPVNIATTVGAYVQTLTKLNLAITGAAGVYSSTIASYNITAAGQTIPASSGTTTAIMSSGTVPLVGTVTDSRGRTASVTVNVTVLAYAPPVITSAVWRRCTSSGVLDESGTYIRLDLNTSVQSLIVGTQKNNLTYKIYAAVRGSAVTLEKTVTVAGSAIVFNSFDTIGNGTTKFPLTNSWDVRVDVSDRFNPASSGSSVATGTIFMHWGTGLGVGKFWEQGGIDILGQGYQNNGRAILDAGWLASAADAVAGSGTKILSPAVGGGTFRGQISAGWFYGLPTVTLDGTGTVINNVHFTSQEADIEYKAGDYVLLNRVGTTFYIVGPDLAVQPKFLPQWAMPVNTGTTITGYSEQNNDSVGTFGEPHSNGPLVTAISNGVVFASMSSTGVVMLSGLLQSAGASTLGSIICTLPVAMRPAHDGVWEVLGNTGVVTVYVCALDGTVRLGNIPSGNLGYFSLDNIIFRASGFGTFTSLAYNGTTNQYFQEWIAGPATTSGTVSFTLPGTNPAIGSHPFGYTTDADGVVLFEGLITCTAAIAASADICTSTGLPALLGEHMPMWCYNLTFQYGRYGATSGGAGTGSSLNIGTAMGINYRFSVSNMKIIPSPNSSTTTGWITPNLYNSWVTYNASQWVVPALLRTNEGMVFARGLFASGTIGTNPVFLLSRKWRPRFVSLQLMASNGLRGRLDVNQQSGGNAGSWNGAVLPSEGSASWISTSGMGWVMSRRSGDDGFTV